MTDKVEEKKDEEKAPEVKIETKAVHPGKDKAIKAEKVAKAEDPVASQGSVLTAGLGGVKIYGSTEDAHDAAKTEAEAAGVSPAAVMHSAPEGASTGDD